MIKNIKLVFIFYLLILVYLLFIDNSMLLARAGKSSVSSRSYYKSTSYSKSYTPSYKQYNTSYPKTYDYSYSYNNYYRPSRYYRNSYNRHYYSTSPYSYNKYDFVSELIGYAISFFVIGGIIIYSFVQSKKNTSSYTSSKYNTLNNYGKKSTFFNNYDDYKEYYDEYDDYNYTSNYNNRYYSNNNSLEYDNFYNNSNNIYNIQNTNNNIQVMNINDFYKLKDINHPDLLKLKDIVKNVFISVQNAWMNKNLDLVMNVISNKLYSKLYYEIEEMKNFAQKNILENIKVLDVKIVNFNDGQNNNFDNELDYNNYYEKPKLNDIMMQAYILAEMIDYVIDENNGQIIEGNNKTKTKFYEQWIFKFENNKWLADEIIRYD